MVIFQPEARAVLQAFACSLGDRGLLKSSRNQSSQIKTACVICVGQLIEDVHGRIICTERYAFPVHRII